MQTIYFDNNATTPMLPQVAEAMAECYHLGYANPASQHAPGRHARQRIEAARESIGRLLGARLDSARADQVVLTSGGTEANNLALCGQARGRSSAGRVAISAVEHPSVVGAAEHLERQGWQIDTLAVDAHGLVDVARLDEQLTDDTRLVSVMLGNNETGVLQPVAQIAEVCRRRGVLMHTDAVQVVGKVPVDFRTLGVDALSCTAHKLHGPRGVGVLLVRHGVSIDPILHGGFQQAGLRPGTESVALAVGMQTALEIWHAERTERYNRLTALRERLETQLLAGDPSAVVHCADAERLPHTSCISFPGVDRQTLVVALDLAGVASATGSACASGSSEPSPVLLAMGLDMTLVNSAIRLSLGYQNTALEVDEAAQRIIKTVNDLRHRSESRKMAAAPRSRSSISL